MRINVYSQEIDLTTDPQIIMKKGEGEHGKETFYGIRFYLHSAPQLHNTEDDDDRTAITFWLPKSYNNRIMMSALFDDAANLIREVIIPATD